MEYHSFVHFCKRKSLRRRVKLAGGQHHPLPVTAVPHLTPMKTKLSSLKSKAVTGRVERYCQSVLPAGTYKRRPVSTELFLLLLLLNFLPHRVCVAQDGFSKEPKITLKFRSSCLYVLRVGLQAGVNLLALKRFVFLFNWEQTNFLEAGSTVRNIFSKKKKYIVPNTESVKSGSDNVEEWKLFCAFEGNSLWLFVPKESVLTSWSKSSPNITGSICSYHSNNDYYSFLLAGKKSFCVVEGKIFSPRG